MESLRAALELRPRRLRDACERLASLAPRCAADDWLLDLGDVRIGVAISDPDRRVAVPFGTVQVGRPPGELRAIAEASLRPSLQAFGLGVGHHRLGEAGNATRDVALDWRVLSQRCSRVFTFTSDMPVTFATTGLPASYSFV